MMSWRQRWRQYLRERRIAKLRDAIDEMTATVSWAAACRTEYEGMLRAELAAAHRQRGVSP